MDFHFLTPSLASKIPVLKQIAQKMAKCSQVNVVHSAFDVVGQMRKKYSLLELCASIRARHATDIDTRNSESGSVAVISKAMAGSFPWLI